MADQLTENPAESLAQLRVLGIPLKVLEDSLMDGHHGRASCSPLHPRWFGGSHQHADTVQGLRLRLIQEKWAPSEKRGFATVVSPDGSFQLAVSSGDHNVGKDGSPRTKNRRGAATASAIEKNGEQRGLFAALLDVLPPRRRIKPTGMTTWFLLYRQTRKEIWFEVSLPMSVDGKGRPNAWERRLKFVPINLSAPPSSAPPSNPTKHEVEVSRR